MRKVESGQVQQLIARTRELRDIRELRSPEHGSLVDPKSAFVTAQTEILLDQLASRLGLADCFESPRRAREVLYTTSQILADSVRILLDRTAAEKSTPSDYSAGVRFFVLSFEQDWMHALRRPSAEACPRYGFQFIGKGTPEVIEYTVNYPELLGAVISPIVESLRSHDGQKVSSSEVIMKIEAGLLTEDFSGPLLAELKRALRVTTVDSNKSASFQEFQDNPEFRRFRGSSPEDLVTDHSIPVTIYDAEGEVVRPSPAPFDPSGIPSGVSDHHTEIRDYAFESAGREIQSALSTERVSSPARANLISFPNTAELQKLDSADPAVLAVVALDTLRLAMTSPHRFNIRSKPETLDEALRVLPSAINRVVAMVEQAQAMLAKDASAQNLDTSAIDQQREEMALRSRSLKSMSLEELKALWTKVYGNE